MSENEVKKVPDTDAKPAAAATKTVAASKKATGIAARKSVKETAAPQNKVSTPAKAIVSKAAKPRTGKSKTSAAKASNASSNASVPSVVAKPKKVKLIRDSFTMPEDEYSVFSVLKGRCLAAGVAAKKSEVLRAALALLATQSDAGLLKAINSLAPIKTGRPAKGGK